MVLVWRIKGKRMLPLSSENSRRGAFPKGPTLSCKQLQATGRQTDRPQRAQKERHGPSFYIELPQRPLQHTAGVPPQLQRPSQLSTRPKHCSTSDTQPNAASCPVHHIPNPVRPVQPVQPEQPQHTTFSPKRRVSTSGLTANYQGSNMRLLNMNLMSRLSQIQNIMASSRQKRHSVSNAMTSQSNRLHVTWGTRPGSNIHA